MSETGQNLWKNDKRVFGITFKGVSIDELKDGIDPRQVNSKQKLAKYIFDNAGSGTYDIRIYQKQKNMFKSSPHTAIRLTVEQTDRFGEKFLLTNFDTSGKNSKFGRRFGLFKRFVDWQEDE